MKLTCLISGMLTFFLSGHLYSDVITQWDFGGTKIPRDVTLYRESDVDAEMELESDNFPEGSGVLVVTKKTGASDRSKLQLFFVSKNTISDSKKYRISFWVQASKDVKISCSALRSQRPWNLLGADGEMHFRVTSEWMKTELIFTSSMNLENESAGARVPQIWLGSLPANTVLKIAKVTFESQD